jgi:hypothetical protein
MAAQILGHTQQGVQGMLCTERRPVLLFLMVYIDSELLEPRHVLENEVAMKSPQYDTEKGGYRERWKGASGSLGPFCRGSIYSALAPVVASASLE